MSPRPRRPRVPARAVPPVRAALAVAAAPLAVLAFTAPAAPAVGPSAGIHLRAGTVPAAGVLPQARRLVEGLASGARGVLLVRAPLPADVTRAGLLDRGVEVLRYLPEGGWLVRGEGATLRAVVTDAAALGLDLVAPLDAALKLAPELSAAPDGAGILVHLLPGEDPARVASVLAAAGSEPVTASAWFGPRVAARVPRDVGAVAARLAALPEVMLVEQRGEVRLVNDRAVPVLQSGSPNGGAPLHDAGLTGAGQIVGYIDTGLDWDGCYFADPDVPTVVTNPPGTGGTATSADHRKVVAYDFLWSGDRGGDARSFDNHGHGTHVGGNIGGAALSAGADRWDGLAPDARFVVQDGGYSGVDDCADLPGLGCPVVDLVPFFEQAYAQGARVHTNSWGDNENSSAQWTYSAGSEDVDAAMWAHKDLLLLFAAGNSGPGVGTVGSPSTAKSALAIGGSGNGAGASRVVSFSSRGPTEDGRIKPDLMAPASNTSADNDGDVTTANCAQDTGSGTSYASPLAAGAAALARQYFMEGFYPAGARTPGAGFTPTGALLKAVLINGAASMSGSSIPSMDQGWGRILLETALPLAGSGRRLQAVWDAAPFAASAAPAYTMTVTVTSNAQPLDVTLAWTDAPGSPAAATALVNDLDLKVSGPGGTWLGNVLSAGRSVAGGSADRLNTVERVRLPSPRAGTYTVTVTPHSIPVGSQDFALVAAGDLRR